MQIKRIVVEVTEEFYVKFTTKCAALDRKKRDVIIQLIKRWLKKQEA